jgi:diaminopimelate epimerase
MTDLRFAKGQALGNDYLVIDAADISFEFSPALARALCDRNRGAGADGVLIADLSASPIRLELLNPDGSEAEKSGNGLRIFAAYLYGRGIVGMEPFQVRLVKDDVTLRVDEIGTFGELQIVADMGRADFRGSEVGFTPRAGEVLGEELSLGDAGSARVHTVSLGNPHCVVLNKTLDRADFLRRAPRLATNAAFRAGTNVQFARVASDNEVEAWIWERGVGETLASGSSACAVAAVATRLGLVSSRDLTILMPGGSVQVHVGEDYSIRLRGPAQIVYAGVVASDIVEAWMLGE